MSVCGCIYICMYIHIHMYIYIYIYYKERDIDTPTYPRIYSRIPPLVHTKHCVHSFMASSS